MVIEMQHLVLVSPYHCIGLKGATFCFKNNFGMKMTSNYDSNCSAKDSL